MSHTIFVLILLSLPMPDDVRRNAGVDACQLFDGDMKKITVVRMESLTFRTDVEGLPWLTVCGYRDAKGVHQTVEIGEWVCVRRGRVPWVIRKWEKK